MAVGICPMCAYGGDTSEKELQKSHVVPKSSFKSTFKGNNPQLGNRLIHLSGDPEENLHVTQDQCAMWMLCGVCEGRLNKEIETPSFKWIRSNKRKTVKADGVLLSRFASSIWWRAMYSKHKAYQYITFDLERAQSLIEASLCPEKTLKNISFRLRRFRDYSGGMSESALNNAIIPIQNHMPQEVVLQRHETFALIAEGLVWEVFYPRLDRGIETKFGCFGEGQKRYRLADLDFNSDPILLKFAREELFKYRNEMFSPAFNKFNSENKRK